MAIQVVHNSAAGQLPLLVHEPCHARTALKAVVVEDADGPMDEPRPDPLEGIPRGVIDIHVEVTEPKRPIGDPIADLVREDPDQDAYVGQPKTRYERLHLGWLGVTMFASAIGGVSVACLDDALEGVAEP